MQFKPEDRKTYSQDIEGDLLLPPARSPTTTARRLTSGSGLEHGVRISATREKRLREEMRDAQQDSQQLETTPIAKTGDGEDERRREDGREEGCTR